MQDNNCAYCGNQAALDVFGIYICDLRISKLYFFKEQSHLGRCIVALNEHVDDITDLDEKQRSLFIEDINEVSTALKKVYQPTKVNYGMYNDKGHHLHTHIVPKYENGFEFGEVFQMNPNLVNFDRNKAEIEIAKIIEMLGK